MFQLTLAFVERVGEGNLLLASVLVFADHCDGGTRSHLFNSNQVNEVGRLNLVVVSGVAESQSEDTLLLQV